MADVQPPNGRSPIRTEWVTLGVTVLLYLVTWVSTMATMQSQVADIKDQLRDVRTDIKGVQVAQETAAVQVAGIAAHQADATGGSKKSSN